MRPGQAAPGSCRSVTNPLNSHTASTVYSDLGGRQPVALLLSSPLKTILAQLPIHGQHQSNLKKNNFPDSYCYRDPACDDRVRFYDLFSKAHLYKRLRVNKHECLWRIN